MSDHPSSRDESVARVLAAFDGDVDAAVAALRQRAVTTEGERTAYATPAPRPTKPARPRTGRVIVLSAIDNLVKGAAGQAIQNFNIACGFDEKMGLQSVPVYP